MGFLSLQLWAEWRCSHPLLLTQSTLQTFIFNYCWVRAVHWIINRKRDLFLAGKPLLWHSPVVRLRWWNQLATPTLPSEVDSEVYRSKTHRETLISGAAFAASSWFCPSVACCLIGLQNHKHIHLGEKNADIQTLRTLFWSKLNKREV